MKRLLLLTIEDDLYVLLQFVFMLFAPTTTLQKQSFNLSRNNQQRRPSLFLFSYLGLVPPSLTSI